MNVNMKQCNKMLFNTSVLHLGLPDVPTLTISPQIIENQGTWGDRAFICEGEAGSPLARMVIESTFGGAFQPFLTKETNHTEIAWINVDASEETSCGYNFKYQFALHKAELSMNLKRFRCVIHPADGLLDAESTVSEEGVIKVVPGNIHTCLLVNSYLNQLIMP